MTKYINTFADLTAYSADTANFSFPHVAFAAQEETVKYDADPGAVGFNIWGTATGDTAPRLFINGLTYTPSFDGNYWKFDTNTSITRFKIDSGKARITSIDKLENRTSDGIIHYSNQYSDFVGLFNGCTNMEKVDVSKIDTSALSSFANVFQGCTKLKTITGIENFVTSGVTNMNSMFHTCSSITTLDLSNWNVSGVTNMNSMFWACSNLKTLSINTWDLQSVTASYTIGMFSNADALTDIYMNGTSQDTLERIKEVIVPGAAPKPKLHRDGVYWTYSGGQWTSTPE